VTQHTTLGVGLVVVLCRVSQVSCGPYHAAAIGSDGRLFTWGDGLFGKLGHGDHCSSHSPRFVTTLAGAHPLSQPYVR
jgi:alpha-tubulin suppressor-like RCC1 family protein